MWEPGGRAKIRLTEDLPILEKHKMVAGLELEGVYEDGGRGRKGFWVSAPGTGEDALVFLRECAVIEWLGE